MKKCITALLLTVLTALIFTACGNTADDAVTEEPAAEKIYENPADFVVLRSENASDAVIQYAVDVRVAFEEASGVRVPITNDFDYVFRNDMDGKKLLLIGKTTYKYTGDDGVERQYADSPDAAAGVNEYVITRFDDGTIMLNASDDDALGAGVDYFLANMLADGQLVLDAGVNRVTGNYTPPPEAVYQYDTVDITRDENAPADLPAMYITLGGELGKSDIPRDEYVPATLALDGLGWCGDVGETPLLIKGRGNYSWGFPKKPYNIKFDKKTDLGGLGAAKKWALVSTYSDKTMLRNYLTLNLGLEAGIACSTECFFVNLYLNGDYRGVYLLTERVQIHKERVDIDPETSDAALFEIEMTYRHGDCTYCLELDSGVHMTLIDPELDDEYSDGTVLDGDAVKSILARSKELLQAADTAMKKGVGEYGALIDIDSFTEWYIVNEFVKNYDSRFVTSCFCYIGDDGKIFMGPPWDFDTCMGNQEIMTCIDPEGWHVNDAPWYRILLKDEDFYAALCEKWAELRDGGVILDGFLAKADAFVADKALSIEANNERWPDTLLQSGLRGGKSLFTYAEEVDYLKNWVSERTAWLDEQFGYGG